MCNLNENVSISLVTSTRGIQYSYCKIDSIVSNALECQEALLFSIVTSHVSLYLWSLQLGCRLLLVKSETR